MTSETLSLFPSQATPTMPKSCLKQPSRTSSPESLNTTHKESLRGLALHVSQTDRDHVMVRPKDAHIKHSLFCEPEIDSNDDLLHDHHLSHASIAPERKYTSNHVPPTLPPRARLPSPPVSYSGAKGALHTQDHAITRTSRTGSRSPPPSANERRPRQSIFPEYDHRKPLSQQNYVPNENALLFPPRSSSLPRSNTVTKPDRPSLTIPTESTEDPRLATITKLQSLWNAASGRMASCTTQKVRLRMHREAPPSISSSSNVEIGFGSQDGHTFYSITASEQSTELGGNELLLRRCHPTKAMTVPIAHIEVSRPHLQRSEESHHDSNATIIFPHTAALAAVEKASTSARAALIQQYDPDATSPQAAQLAHDAVAEAHQFEECQLISLPGGAVHSTYTSSEPRYELRHPRLGNFGIVVHGRIDLFHTPVSDPLASRYSRLGGHDRIVLYHPPPTDPECIDESKVGLVSLDTSTGMLEINIAAYRNLKSAYALDTTVCALMTVAMKESQRDTEAWRSPVSIFAAPPGSSGSTSARGMAKFKVDVRDAKDKPRKTSRVSSIVGSLFRGTKHEEVQELEMQAQTPAQKPLPPPPQQQRETRKLPVVTRIILRLLGFSFEAIVWLLGLGVKVLTKLLGKIGNAVERV